MFDAHISHQTFIVLPIERVFAAITDAGVWNTFFTSGMELEPRPGGRMVWRWNDWGPNNYTTEADALVRTVESPTRFAFEWYPVGREYPTTVEFRLIAERGGTTVRLTESGYPDNPAAHRMICECAAGWGEALTLMKFYLEHGLVYRQPNSD